MRLDKRAKSELSSAAEHMRGTARRRAISTVLRITGDRDGVEVTAASNAVNGTTCRIASRAPVRHGRKVMRAVIFQGSLQYQYRTRCHCTAPSAGWPDEHL